MTPPSGGRAPGGGAPAGDGPGGAPGRPRVWLVDGSGYVFRAFHAVPTRLTSDGAPVNAVFGFVSMMLRLEERLGPEDSLAVVFDAPGGSFRTALLPGYKSSRAETPPDLASQLPTTREAVDALGRARVEAKGWEADDLLASQARAVLEAGLEAVVVSSDKDLMQLVRPGVSMWDPAREAAVGPAEVEARFGVPPGRVADVQALAGDPGDDVPGVPGVGVKTAAALVREHGGLEEVLAAAPSVRQPKRRQALTEHADAARLAMRLVRLDGSAPAPLTPEAIRAARRDPARLRAFLDRLGFRSLAARLERDGRLPPPGAGGGAPGEEGAAAAPGPGPEEMVEEARALGRAALVLEPGEGAPGEARLAAFSLEVGPGGPRRFEVIPDGPAPPAPDGAAPPAPGAAAPEGSDGSPGGLFGGAGGADAAAPGAAAGAEPSKAPPQGAQGAVSEARARALLGPLLADPLVLKILPDAKEAMRLLGAMGLPLEGFDDLGAMAHALGPAGRAPEAPPEAPDGAASNAPPQGAAPSSAAPSNAPAQPAQGGLAGWRVLRRRLARSGLSSVYETLERPLPPVLAAMEAEGVRIDSESLRALSEELEARAAVPETRARALAGRDFALGSPRQVAEVLFSESGMGLRSSGRRGRSGALSTDREALEALAAEGHELPARVLEWRALAKLRSTWAEALPRRVSPATGRVHTRFSQTGTAAGRLSSSDPNLQNIPARTEDGMRVRRAFVAGPGRLLISVDYGQIELRVAAEMAGEETLLEALRAGRDVHAATAAEVFGLAPGEVTEERRRAAKAINFGALYGISAFGLARSLGIPMAEAARFLESHRERLPALRAWTRATLEGARARGFVETLFGRRVATPEVDSRVPARRAAAERAAVNAPVQGTAADLMRRAMARAPGALAAEGLSARLLLQVHDELVLEAPEEEAARAAEAVRRCMEGAAAPLWRPRVPLVAAAGTGASWAEAHP